MAFQAVAISTSIIEVYSDVQGTFPFTLTNEDTLGVQNGNLT